MRPDERDLTFRATVEPDGRIVIPEAICIELGWRDGTVLRVSLAEDLVTKTLIVVLRHEADADA